MICDKCGKNSRKEAVCSHCGEKMPETTNCGGFADILSFSISEIPGADTNGKVFDLSDVKNLIQRTDCVVKHTRRSMFWGLLTVVLCFAVLVSNVVTAFVTINVINNHKEETVKHIAEAQSSLKDIKEQLNKTAEELQHCKTTVSSIIAEMESEKDKAESENSEETKVNE